VTEIVKGFVNLIAALPVSIIGPWRQLRAIRIFDEKFRELSRVRVFATPTYDLGDATKESKIALGFWQASEAC